MGRGTKKPCPGCGESVLRPMDKVCSSCISLMADGRRFRMEVDRLKSEEYQLVRVPDNWCRPRFFLSYPGESAYEEERIGVLLKELAHLLLNHGRESHYHSGGLDLYHKLHDSRYDWVKEGLMRKDVAEKLQDLYLGIDAVLKRVRDHSVRCGKNLLLQLHAGKITVEEFEKK